MNQIREVPLPHAPSKRAASRTPIRLFYIGSAALMLLLAFIGFNKFYLHGQAFPGREIAPPIRALVITHGIAMTAWLGLLLAQPTLIAARKHRLHMQIGKLGALLAAVILITGLWLAIRSAAVTPPEVVLFTLPPKPFMAVPFHSVVIFAIFVALGVIYRRTPHIHRSMMLLATLSAMSAAVARIQPLNDLYAGTEWERLFGPFLFTLVIGFVLLGIRSAMMRSIDRPFAIGMIVLTALSVGIMLLAPTELWAAFTGMLVP
jgi:hypothetical protein